MRKISYFFVFFAMLCIFFGISAPGEETNEEKECYISAPSTTEVKHEAQRHGVNHRVNFNPAIISTIIEIDYKHPVILPEFEDVDREPDFRIQYPRRTTTEENEAFCK